MSEVIVLVQASGGITSSVTDLKADQRLEWVYLDWDEIHHGSDSRYHRNTIAELWPWRHNRQFNKDIRDAIRKCIERIRLLEEPTWKRHDYQAAAFATWGACPQCGKSEIQGGSIDIEGEFAYQTVQCLNCNLSWSETYQAHARSDFR